MKIFRSLAALSALALAAAAPAPPPVLPPGLATPAAHPYDETADAHLQVDAAFAQARATHRLVLLDFGGNWCPDCRMLGGVFAQPDVQHWMDQTFVSVLIDVGRFKKNMDIAQRYGVTVKAVPSVLVLTPEGRVLDAADVTALSDDRGYSQQAVVNELAKMAGPGS